MDTDLTANAYHEAGHAVLAFLCGSRIKRITIEPNEGDTGWVLSPDGDPIKEIIVPGDAGLFAGLVDFYDGEHIENLLGMDNCSNWLRDHPEDRLCIQRMIRCLMAGSIAQDLGIPGSLKSYMWENDKQQIEIMIFMLGLGDQENEWKNTEKEVCTLLKKNWSLVERLSKVLLERKTLAEKEVNDLLQS